MEIRNLYASQGLDYHTEDGIFIAEEKIPLIEQAVSSFNWQAAVKAQELCSPTASFYLTFLIS
ncbi:hypothetical protein OAK48_00480 [Deltaproteobacteria bacterium]|nr:hypothetical protein [Deltaproteobacteria bacterium]